MTLSYVDGVATVFSAAALYGLFLSRDENLREHTTRLGAVLLIAAITLFSDHAAVYFAAIFIVATAVTELDFLQNLAAILRGNADYFRYKIEQLGTKEQEEKAKREQAELDGEKPEAGGSELKAAVRLNRIMNAEAAALDRMEEYFGAKIKRNVRISSGNEAIELDGLIPSIVDDVKSERLIEVKYLRSPGTFSNFVGIFARIEQVARQYTLLAKKIAKLHIVLVIEGEKTLSQADMKRLKEMVDRSDIAAGYSVFTTSDLNIEPRT